MSSDEIFNPNLFLEVVEKLKELERLLRDIENKDVVRRISKNDVVVRGELYDLDVIWNRFLENRKKLLLIDPKILDYLDQDEADTEVAKQLHHDSQVLQANLKVDLKSLFLFGDILFNKLALLVRSVYEERQGVKYESFSSFLKSLKKLKSSTAPESVLYKEIGDDLEKIEVILGFYRDKFVVHVLGPYQEEITRSIAFPEFRLDHTSWKLDKFDFEKFNELINQLKGILPQKDKFGRPLDQPSDPRPKVEVLFSNLHKIADPTLKERAEGFIRSVGLESPNIYQLAKAIRDSAIRLVEYLMGAIKSKYVRL